MESATPSRRKNTVKKTPTGINKFNRPKTALEVEARIMSPHDERQDSVK